MTSPDLRSIGERIRWLRKEQGMLQGTLAKKAGFSQASLSQVESGLSKSPSAPVLLRIAAALNANPVNCACAVHSTDKRAGTQ